MALTVEKLSKKAGDRWVLRDVNFTVGRGEIFGIIGLDGESEQLILRLIANVESADSGEILFENAAIQPDKAIYFPKDENVSGWKKIFGKASEMNLNRVETFENTLAESEQILLLDGWLNCSAKGEKTQLLKRLRTTVKQKNLSVVLTSKNDEAIFSCDKIAVLHNGEIIQTGTPREIYESPNSIAAAASIGENNFIKARLLSSSKSDLPEFQTLEGEHRFFTSKTEKRLLGAINQDVTLAIRPEHISISFGASFPEDNLIRAKISEIHFRGATTLMKLEANGLNLEAVVLRLVGLNVGDECMVGLPPDRILVLKD